MLVGSHAYVVATSIIGRNVMKYHDGEMLYRVVLVRCSQKERSLGLKTLPVSYVLTLWNVAQLIRATVLIPWVDSLNLSLLKKA